MNNVAESRRNMRIDMRPKVVARVMSKELILLGLALTCAVGMPLYFYKLKALKDDYVRKNENALIAKQEEELKQKRLAKLQRNTFSPMSSSKPTDADSSNES